MKNTSNKLGSLVSVHKRRFHVIIQFVKCKRLNAINLPPMRSSAMTRHWCLRWRWDAASARNACDSTFVSFSLKTNMRKHMEHLILILLIGSLSAGKAMAQEMPSGVDWASLMAGSMASARSFSDDPWVQKDDPATGWTRFPPPCHN